MSKRSQLLFETNYGRLSPWTIELDGKVVGELKYDADDQSAADMFWEMYHIHSDQQEVVRCREHWEQCRFQFKNRDLNEYARYAFGGGLDELPNGRVAMRSLLLTPNNSAEEWEIYWMEFKRGWFSWVK